MHGVVTQERSERRPGDPGQRFPQVDETRLADRGHLSAMDQELVLHLTSGVGCIVVFASRGAANPPVDRDHDRTDG